MTALLESQLGLLKKVETSDETFAEIKGMKEAVEEVEAVEREIEAKTAEARAQEECAEIVHTGEEPVAEEVPVMEEIVQPEPEVVVEEVVEAEPVITPKPVEEAPAFDPNATLSPEDIAKLFASMGS